VSFPEWSL